MEAKRDQPHYKKCLLNYLSGIKMAFTAELALASVGVTDPQGCHPFAPVSIM